MAFVFRRKAKNIMKKDKRINFPFVARPLGGNIIQNTSCSNHFNSCSVLSIKREKAKIIGRIHRIQLWSKKLAIIDSAFKNFQLSQRRKRSFRVRLPLVINSLKFRVFGESFPFIISTELN